MRLLWFRSQPAGRKWHATAEERGVFRTTLCGRGLLPGTTMLAVLPQEAIHRLEVCAVCWRKRNDA